MVRSHGNTGRAVTATTGIDIPLAPRALSDAEVEARMFRPGAAGDTAAATISRLQAELTQARTTISDLQERVQLHGEAISTAAAHVQASVSRAETAETQLVEAHERIEALIAELATAPAPPTVLLDAPAPVSAPSSAGVRCAGGCGVQVAREYVDRTGRTWHGTCQDQVPAHLLQTSPAAGTAAPATRRAAA